MRKEKVPILCDLCEVKFVRNKTTMKYKTRFTGDYQEVMFLKDNYDLYKEHGRLEKDRGISRSKLDNIQSVLKNGATPEDKMHFWNNLVVSDVDDLSTTRDCD